MACSIKTHAASEIASDAPTATVTILGIGDKRNRCKKSGWKTTNKKSPVKNVELWQRLDELLRRESGYGIPRPGTGAGIGIPLTETIVKLHRGSLLMNTGEDGIPVAVLALPTGPMPTRVTVRTPKVQRSGGLSAPLVALADILPAESFCPEEEANLST